MEIEGGEGEEEVGIGGAHQEGSVGGEGVESESPAVGYDDGAGGADDGDIAALGYAQAASHGTEYYLTVVQLSQGHVSAESK